MTMTDTEAKALALVNEVSRSGSVGSIALHDWSTIYRTLCRAIEQHEAFRQEVSTEMLEYSKWCKSVGLQFPLLLERFIIAKPDPLVEAWIEATGNTVGMEPLNAALAARGLKIVKKEPNQ